LAAISSVSAFSRRNAIGRNIFVPQADFLMIHTADAIMENKLNRRAVFFLLSMYEWPPLQRK